MVYEAEIWLNRNKLQCTPANEKTLCKKFVSKQHPTCKRVVSYLQDSTDAKQDAEVRINCRNQEILMMS